MKTSSSQFDLMVTFMEQHGDLSKPISNARGRIACFKLWEELAVLLNSDGSGASRNSEKWKKVWSDYKNNTKKKAARLHRSASGTGGGPATFTKLSDLEQRVLNLIGVQVATGLMVEEAGLPQMIHIQPSQPSTSTSVNLEDTPTQEKDTPIHQLVVCLQEPPNIISPLPPAPAISSPPHAIFPGDEELENIGMLTPPKPPSPVHVPRPGPALSGETTPRRVRSTRIRGSPRRRIRPAHTEQAAKQFLEAEEYWRNFKLQQHQDYMELRREQNRIREMEVLAQREWQTLGSRTLDILDKLVNKYCKD